MPGSTIDKVRARGRQGVGRRASSFKRFVRFERGEGIEKDRRTTSRPRSRRWPAAERCARGDGDRGSQALRRLGRSRRDPLLLRDPRAPGARTRRRARSSSTSRSMRLARPRASARASRYVLRDRRDLGAQRERAEAPRALAERGHEIGNHSLDHRYDLTRLDGAEIARRDRRRRRTPSSEPRDARPSAFARRATRSPTSSSTCSRARASRTTRRCSRARSYWARQRGGASRLIALRGRQSRSILDTPQRAHGADAPLSRRAPLLEARRRAPRSSPSR